MCRWPDDVDVIKFEIKRENSENADTTSWQCHVDFFMFSCEFSVIYEIHKFPYNHTEKGLKIQSVHLHTDWFFSKRSVHPRLVFL